MTRVLVAGARGYLGRAVVAGLAGELDLVGLVGSDPAGSAHPQAELLRLDLLDKGALATALAALRPDAVINAAGRLHGTAHELYRDNAALAATLAEAMLQAAPGALLIQFGSAAEYGRPQAGAALREDDPCRPVGLYGFSKLAAADYLFHLCAAVGLRLNHLRIFNPVAATNSSKQVLGAFVDKARAATVPKRVEMGRLDAVRDFVVLDDLLTLTRRLIREPVADVVVNVCSGRGRRIRDVIRYLAERCPDPVEVIERGPQPAANHSDVAVGNASRFLSLSGLAEPSSVEAALARVWD